MILKIFIEKAFAEKAIFHENSKNILIRESNLLMIYCALFSSSSFQGYKDVVSSLIPQNHNRRRKRKPTVDCPRPR